MFYARQGGPAAVAPYCADPQNLHSWQLDQRRHRERLAAVPKTIDQSEPPTLVDASLHRGRERSRVFHENERHREVGKENIKLMGALRDIAQKQAPSLKRVESDPWLPRVPVSSNKDYYRRLKQKALDAENEAMVKRLLKVRTTFDRKKDERQFQRHKRAVQDMQKVPPPQSVAKRERKPLHLPQLQGDRTKPGTKLSLDSASPTSVAALEAPSMRLRFSRSLPNLPTKSALRQSKAIQDAHRSSQSQAVAPSEAAKPFHRDAEACATASKPAQQDPSSLEASQKAAAVETPQRHVLIETPNVSPASKDGSAIRLSQPAGSAPLQLPLAATGHEGQELNPAEREMMNSRVSWKSSSPTSEFWRSPRQVLTPGCVSGGMSDVANSEIAADIIGTVSSNWYATKTDASGWTVRSEGDELLFDSGYDNLGLTEEEVLNASAISATEVVPSWFASGAEGEEQADNDAHARADLQ